MEEEQDESMKLGSIEPGKAQPNYSGFLTLRMNEIWEQWAHGNNEGALVLAIRLAETFVPKKFKKPLEKEVETITRALQKAQSVSDIDSY